MQASLASNYLGGANTLSSNLVARSSTACGHFSHECEFLQFYCIYFRYNVTSRFKIEHTSSPFRKNAICSEFLFTQIEKTRTKYIVKILLQPKTTYTSLKHRHHLCKSYFVTYHVYKSSYCQTDTFLFLLQNIYTAFPCKTGRSDNQRCTGYID